MPAQAQNAPSSGDLQPISESVLVGESRCLDRETIAQQLRIWLKRDTLSRRIAIFVEDEPDGVSYRVERDGSPIGERTLDVVDIPCQQIHAAVGLGAAMALDATLLPSIAPDSVAPAPAPTEPTLPPPVSSPPAPPPSPRVTPVFMPPPNWGPPPSEAEPDAEPRRDVRLTATAYGMVLVGVLPEVALGGGVSFDLELLPFLDLRAGGFATAETSAPVSNGSADLGLIAGRLDGCAVSILKEDVARVRGCAGFVAGAVQAQGVGFQRSTSATAPWIGPAARADGRWSFGTHFGMLLGVDAFFPGVKPRLEVEGDGDNIVAAESFPLAGVVLSLGPSITF